LLFLFGLGAARAAQCWRELPERRRAILVLAIWTMVPLVRVTLPGMVNFDGIRHFLEFWPPFAAFGALGIEALFVWSRRSIGKRPLAVASAALVLLLLMIPPLHGLIRTHPFQLAYYNAILGGLGDAQQRGHSDATDYWAASYLQGMRWIERNIERPATLVVPVASHVAELYSKRYLPAEVEMLTLTFAGGPEVPPQNVRYFRKLVFEAERPPIYVMFVTRRSWYNEIVALTEERGEEVMRIEVDGGVILKIYRL